jgi:hypothetical protein
MLSSPRKDVLNADTVVCWCACACRDKPRLVSDGEKMALLYNIACCHSQMQDARSGLVALAGALLAGSNSCQQWRLRSSSHMRSCAFSDCCQGF